MNPENLKSFLTQRPRLYSLAELLVLMLSLCTSSVWAAYSLDKTSTTSGNSSWGSSILAMTVSLSGSNITFKVSKSAGGSFSSSGTMYLKVGTYESYGVDRGSKSVIANSTTSLSFTHDLNAYPGYPKDFYARYQGPNSTWAWVGPIKVSSLAAPKPAIPNAPTASATGTNSINLSWSAVSNAAVYGLWRADSATGTYKQIYCAANPSYADSGTHLLPATTYYYKVKAGNSEASCSDGASGGTTGWSDFSGVGSAKTQTAPLPDTELPTGQITGIGKTYLIKDTIAYTVQGQDNKALSKLSFSVANANNVQKYNRSWDVSGTSANYSDSFSTSGWEAGTYYYALWVKDAAGNTKDYTGSFALSIPKPPIPSIPTVSATGANSIDISWPAVSNAAIYGLWRADSSAGTYKQIDCASGTSKTDSGAHLLPVTTYYYKVKAGNSEASCSDGASGGTTGWSDFSGIGSATTQAKVSIDTEAPTGNILGINSTYTVGETLSYQVQGQDNEALSKLSFSVADANNVQKYNRSWDVVSGTSANYSDSLSTAGWGAGTYYYALWVKDKAGNAKEEKGSFTLAQAHIEQASFVSETYQDDTLVKGGESFIKEWVIKNTGTTTWTADYKLKYVSGSLSTNKNNIPVSGTVSPNSTFVFRVPMKAPEAQVTEKSYVEKWQFVGPTGNVIKIDDATEIWAKIKVAGVANSEVGDIKKIASYLFNIPLQDIDSEKGAYYNYNLWKKPLVEKETGCQGYEGGHSGIDIQTKDVAGTNTANREFYAVSEGTVIVAGGGSYNTIAIYDASQNITTLYLHARSVFVKVDDNIKVGDLLGIQGDKGVEPNEHVHLEVRQGRIGSAACGATTTLNPEPYLLAYLSSQSVPSTPNKPIASATGTNSIDVSWSSVSNAVIYALWRADSPSGTYKQIDCASKTSKTDSGSHLSPVTTYYYKVKAGNSKASCGVNSTEGWSALSEAVSVKTLQASLDDNETLPVVKDKLDIGNLTIYADVFKNEGNIIVATGNIVLAKKGGSKLLKVDSTDLRIDKLANKVESVGEANLTALNIEHGQNEQIENIRFYSGMFTINPSESLPTIDLATFFKLPGLPSAFSPVMLDNDELVFQDVEADPIDIEEVVLSQSGNSTGKITIEVSEELLEIWEPMKKLVNEWKLRNLAIEIDPLKGTWEGTAGFSIPKVLDVEKVTLGFEMGSFIPDKFEIEVNLEDKELTIPTTPPSSLGALINSALISAENITSNNKPLELKGKVEMSLTDALGTLPEIEEAINSKIISGEVVLSVDLIGKIELFGDVNLLENYPLANANIGFEKTKEITTFNIGGKITLPNLIGGKITLPNLLTGELNLKASKNKNVVQMTGETKAILEVPNDKLWIGGQSLDVDAAVDLRFNLDIKEEIKNANSIANIAKLKDKFIEKAEFSAGVNWKGIDLEVTIDAKNIPPSVKEIKGLEQLIPLFNKRGVRQGDLQVPQQYVVDNDIVVIKIVSHDSAALFTLTLPDGTIYTPSNTQGPQSSAVKDVFFFRNETAHETYYILKGIQSDHINIDVIESGQKEGSRSARKNVTSNNYVVEVLNANDLGNYELELWTPNTKPSITIDIPATDQVWDGHSPIDISWTDEDPDNNAEISLYYDTDNTGYNGLLIAENIAEDDENDTSSWQVGPEVQSGTYYIYAKIDDGEHAPVFAYSLGKVIVSNPDAPATPQNVVLTPGDGKITVSWDANQEDNLLGYRVFLSETPGDGIFEYDFGVGSATSYEIEGLVNGRTYEIAVSAINTDLLKSHLSPLQQQAPNGTGPSGGPDLKVNTSASKLSSTTLQIRVENQGEFSSNTAKISYYIGGNLIDSQIIGAIPPGGYKDISFQQNAALATTQSVLVKVKEVTPSELNTSNNLAIVKLVDKNSAVYGVSGKIFDKSATPLTNVTVQIGDKTATTDDTGHWEIQGLPPGEYTLLASKTGYLFAPKTLTLDADHAVVEMDLHEATINPATCQLYAVDDQGLNNSQFFTVSLDQQQVSNLGTLHKGYDLESLAIDPQTNLIYAASGNDVATGKPKGQLYLVDGQTGELFSVGNTGFEEIGDLAFDAQGTLWAWAKGQGLITIDVTTGAGTLVLPSTLKLAGLTLSKEAGTVFYGAVDQDLWRYDFSNQQLDVMCSNLGGKTEAIEVIWGDLLLLGEHQDQTLSLHAFDPKLCQVVAGASVSTPQHQDVEGIALPVGACR